VSAIVGRFLRAAGSRVRLGRVARTAATKKVE
jgi:hypothetical protein